MNLLQPYILLYKIVFLVLVGTLVVFSLRKKYENHPFEKYDSFGSWIIFFILSLFIGFRNETVGTDTSTYVSFFHSSQFLYNGEPTDPFFELFARLIHIVSPHTETFIAMTGVVSLFGIFFLIQKKSEYKCLSWILFCISGSCFVTLFLYLSVIRQACSITFFILAVYIFFEEPFQKKKCIVYSAIFYIIAVLMHGSTLVSFPFLLLIKKGTCFRKHTWVVLLLVTYTLAALNISFANTITSTIFQWIGPNKYGGYGSISFGFITPRGVFNMILLPFMALAMIVLFSAKKNFYKEWYVQCFLYSVLLNNIFFDNLMWSRLILCLAIFLIVALPNALSYKSFKIKMCYYVPILSYYLYKSMTYLATNFYDIGNIIVPYRSWFLDPLFY